MARILIIDDEDQPRRMLQQVLIRAGYEVVEARDGNQGLQLFRVSQTDLIITDILMPEKEVWRLLSICDVSFQPSRSSPSLAVAAPVISIFLKSLNALGRNVRCKAL